MYTNFTDWESGLRHFGVRGMKWGQRRFQNPDGSLTSLGQSRYGVNGNRGRLGIKHDLNKLDRENVHAKVRADYYGGKAARRLAKAERRMAMASKNNNLNKAAKQKAKIERINQTVGKKAADYKKLLNRNQAMSDRIIKKALSKGYSVKSRDTVRSVNRGRSAAVSGLGIAAGAATGVGFVYGQRAVGKHYRVVNDGLGIRTHRSRRHHLSF